MEVQCVTCTAAFTSMSALGRHFQDAHQQGKPDGHGRLEMGGASFADNAAAERELMMFESVRTESQATQERVLRASKACAAPAPTLDGLYSPPKPYPTNRAAFRKVSAAGAPDLVREAVLMQGTVDLSSVGLPDITFEYIDPVWVWVQQAAAVGKHYKLWFEAVTDWNDSGERMYGRGVETGDAMRQALKKCGPFELPALLGLHFDKAKLGAR